MAADSRPKASVLLSLLCFAFLLFSRVPSLLEVGDVDPGPRELSSTTPCLSEVRRLDLRGEQREVCVGGRVDMPEQRRVHRDAWS